MDQIPITLGGAGGSPCAPPTLVHRTSVARALTTLPRASNRLARAIFDCLALPPDGTGLIASAEALRAACAALGHGEPPLDDWRNAFHRLSLELQSACGVTHELDRAQLLAGHPRRHAAIALLEPLSFDLGTNARAVVDERRRRLYVHAVTWQLELSPIGLQLRQLNRAASASNRSEIRLRVPVLSVSILAVTSSSRLGTFEALSQPPTAQFIPYGPAGPA